MSVKSHASFFDLTAFGNIKSMMCNRTASTHCIKRAGLCKCSSYICHSYCVGFLHSN